MPQIPFGVGAYRRERGALPEFTLVNMFPEKTPSAENGVALMSRPPLGTHSTAGNGPITGIFSQEGTLGGDVFRVSAGNLYRNTTLIGAIVGDGAISWAASATEVLVTAGETLYSYNGTNFAAVAFPDSADVRAVTFLSGHFIAVRDGTHKFYWSAQLDGRTFDALDFASAESEPDALLDAVTMRGNLYNLGQTTIEPWLYTGTLDLPFSLIQQRLFPKGVIATGCALEMDNALLWVGNDRMVYRTADVPERLSNHGIEERIEQSDSVSVLGFIHEGHSHFAFRLDEATYAIDLATGQWWELQTYGQGNFRGRCSTMVNGVALFGDSLSGAALSFAEDFTEEDTMTREFTGAFPIKGGTQIVDSVTVDANSGRTTHLAGQGTDPLMEMATSRDAGATWGAFRSARLGAQGEYRARTRWTRLGMFDAPGAMFKFRFTDPSDLRVSNVFVNEPGGGRSRVP